MAEERTSSLDRARSALHAATGRDDPTFARAAQIAIVAQAEAAHRQADALERIAAALEQVAGCVDDDGPNLVVRPQIGSFGEHLDALRRLAATFEEAHA